MIIFSHKSLIIKPPSFTTPKKPSLREQNSPHPPPKNSQHQAPQPYKQELLAWCSAANNSSHPRTTGSTSNGHLHPEVIFLSARDISTRTLYLAGLVCCMSSDSWMVSNMWYKCPIY